MAETTKRIVNLTEKQAFENGDYLIVDHNTKGTRKIPAKIMNNYVIPQMYGAKTDGVTDDLTAFSNAISSGENVVIPQGNYYLSDYIFGDESQIIENKGEYTNKKVIVSKPISKAPMSMVNRKSILLTELGTSWGSGVAYNSDTKKLLCCGYEDNKVAEVDLETLTVENIATITGLGHGNDVTYNPITKKYYCAPMKNTGEIMIINNNLTLDTTLTIEGMEFIPSQISYDPDNDIYYVGNSQYTYAVDSNFNIIRLLSTHKNNELFENNYKNIDTCYSQGSTVINGQFIAGVWLFGVSIGINHGRSYSRLVSYNYSTGEINSLYDFPLPILGEEFEAVENIDGKLYLFSCRFGTLFITIIYPDKLYLAHNTPDYPDYVDATRIDNNYCTETDIKRLRTFTNGNIGVLKLNLLLSTELPANTTNVKIANLNVRSYDEFLVNVPSQNNLGNLLVDIKTNGDVYISNPNNTPLSGFYRSSIALMIT